jgi:hypothetical protein
VRLANLWRWTGDRDALARLLPVAENVLRWFEPFRAEDGLATDVTSWVILDWSSVSGDGKSSVLNALWARGLRDFAELAEALGDAGRAGWARGRHAELARAFELFWDPGRTLYVDVAVGAERRRPASQHAQAAALAAGLVPAARAPRVADAMMDEARLVHATGRWPGDAQAAPRRGRDRRLYSCSAPAPWWDVERELSACRFPLRRRRLAAAGRRPHRRHRDWAALSSAATAPARPRRRHRPTAGPRPDRDPQCNAAGVTPAEASARARGAAPGARLAARVAPLRSPPPRGGRPPRP